jgi:hypothetical protein
MNGNAAERLARADGARGRLSRAPSGLSWNNTGRRWLFQMTANWLRTKREIMRVHVERDTGDVGAEKLKCFRLGGRRVEVIENVDRWFGPDYAYFKVRGNDGNLYILRLDEAHDAWELTMFQSPDAETFAAAHAVRRPRGDRKD